MLLDGIRDVVESRAREREKKKRKKECTNRLKSERDRVARGFFRCERRSSALSGSSISWKHETRRHVTDRIHYRIPNRPVFLEIPSFSVFILRD